MKQPINITSSEWEAIEDLLNKGGTEAERVAFVAQQRQDKSFRDKVELVKMTSLAISEASLKAQLDDYHQELTAHTQPTVPATKGSRHYRRKPLLIAASVIALMGLAIWGYQQINRDSSGYHRYYKADPGLITAMGTSKNYTFEKAMVDYKDGAYEEAIQAWSAMLNTNPGNDTLLYFLGAAYQASARTDHALTYFREVLEFPESFFYRDACWYAGLIYLKQGETAAATPLLQQSGREEAAEILSSLP